MVPGLRQQRLLLAGYSTGDPAKRGPGNDIPSDCGYRVQASSQSPTQNGLLRPVILH